VGRKSLDCSGMKLITEALDAVKKWWAEPSALLVLTSCAMTHLGAVRY
jgi:hypothetical protein